MKLCFFKVVLTCSVFAVLLMASSGHCQEGFADNSSVFGEDSGQKRIDIDILNMDIESVLKIISDASGWTIIPSQKIRGKVSLWSKGATARQLLDKLTLVNNYVYEQEGNVIFLMTKDEYEQFFGRTAKTFYLEHQKAENIKNLVENSLTKNGKLGIDSWSNTIVVNDTEENLKKIETLINRLDQGFVQKRFQLVNARSDDVAQILDKLCPKEGPFQADIRTNSIIVFNSESNVERIAKLISQLDKDVITRVFQIKFQKASELAPQLSALLSGSGYSRVSGDSQMTGKQKQIIVSDSTNQIVVTASASKVEYIASLIEELDSKVTTVTIALKNLKASEVLEQVAQLASKPENIKADSQGNRLIIHDNTQNIEQIRKLVQNLDEDVVTKVFVLEHAMAEDIANVLGTMVTNPDAFKAVPRTNQIIISASQSQIARLEKIIKKLDREDAYFTRTYNLSYASASLVAAVIEKFISGQISRRTYLDKGMQKQNITSREPGEQIKSEPPLAPSQSSPDLRRTGRNLGSAPGLAGTHSSDKQAAMSPTTSLTPPSSSPPPGSETSSGPAAAQSSSKGIGLAGIVVADERSNTVTITEKLTTLTRIEKLIKKLDIPVKSYSYTFEHRRMDSLDLDSKLSGLLWSEQDSFSIDNQSHSVNFTTIPSAAQRILDMLQQWDKPAKQALIRAKIIAVNTSKLKDMGINLESLFNVSNVDVLLESSLPSQVGSEHFGSLTVRKLTGTQYEAILRAVESDNNSQILASPRILALDGQPAEVRMATDEPFTETSIDAQNGRTIQNIRFLQVGTTLMVTPHIREDNTIEIDVGLDVSSLIEIRNGIPVVNHNIASSTVAVKNNHILMMGGLKFKRDMNVEERIPILSDMPLIGGLFSSRRKELTDSELVLLLQPTIVSASESVYEPVLTEKGEILMPEGTRED